MSFKISETSRQIIAGETPWGPVRTMYDFINEVWKRSGKLPTRIVTTESIWNVLLKLQTPAFVDIGPHLSPDGVMEVGLVPVDVDGSLPPHTLLMFDESGQTHAFEAVF